jgi:hypothetical protein
MAPLHNAKMIALLGVYSFNKIHSLPRLAKQSSSIADPFVNDRRDSIRIDGCSLHDFVPLYFATHTPMQYVVTVKQKTLAQSELIFFVFDANQIFELPGVLSTDGNAASRQTEFYQGNGSLQYIDWNIINKCECWSKDYKRRKCAEVLVPDHIPCNMIRAIVVNQKSTMRKLRSSINRGHFGVKRIDPVEIFVNQDFYYRQIEAF